MRLLHNVASEGKVRRPDDFVTAWFSISSHIFRHLIPQLAKKYHGIATDYPSFANSDMPSIDNLVTVILPIDATK
ncbi:MAG: alpha/beta hydrolase fold protein [Osedax symbiont Rs1]|nr:MAG: alpha/beta hydrolase fold protein [Osedax symbiont Rs1]